MANGRLIFIGGGVRCGKSRYALMRAKQCGERRVFLATAQAYDDEMKTRIAAHQAERAAEFMTIEEPLAIPEAIRLAPVADALVLDCLTLWLANMLLVDEENEAIETAIAARVDECLAACQARSGTTIIVSNEVGMGIVPESRNGRMFRDIAGRAHQRIAHAADEVYLATMGTMLRLRPSPVECVVV